ncbi:MAG: hypothetical protein LQ347_000148 [Umbilicaria vellea]|nr:MAG: hypothetical protein LQ347_000148 [Umbilicaria vellea]
MSPPDAEWLLWAKRFHMEYHSLLQRFTALEKSARQRQERAFGNEEMLDQIEALTRASNALRESNLNLEKDIGVLKKIVQRTQDEAKLANSEHQKSLAELDATKKRIWKLENGIDRITSDQSGEDAKKQHRVLQARIDRLTQELHQWQSGVTAGNQRQENINFSRKLKLRASKTPKGSASQATTVAGTVVVNDTAAEVADTPQEKINGLAQSQLTLEEYFSYSKDFMGRVRANEEGIVVRAFVAGLRDKVIRIPLQEVLDVKGWTWEETKAEIERVIAHMQKIKRTKRYTVPPEEMDAYMKMAL